MLINNTLKKPCDDYSTGPRTSFESDLNPLLLIPGTKRNWNVSSPASYRTTNDGFDTLGISSKIQHVLPSRKPPMINGQAGEALAMLTQGDAGISCWLSRIGHAMYRCLYLTFGQQSFTAYRAFEHRTAADMSTGRVLMGTVKENDPDLYVAHLRQAKHLVRALTNSPTGLEIRRPRHVDDGPRQGAVSLRPQRIYREPEPQ